MEENMNREEHSNATIFVMVAFAFILKLLICVASKVHFNFLKSWRKLKRAMKRSLGSGG